MMKLTLTGVCDAYSIHRALEREGWHLAPTSTDRVRIYKTSLPSSEECLLLTLEKSSFTLTYLRQKPESLPTSRDVKHLLSSLLQAVTSIRKMLFASSDSTMKKRELPSSASSTAPTTEKESPR